jgi:hypothetical protein
MHRLVQRADSLVVANGKPMAAKLLQVAVIINAIGRSGAQMLTPFAHVGQLQLIGSNHRNARHAARLVVLRVGGN